MIDGRTKEELIDNILEKVSEYTTGKQLLTLNRCLNNVLITDNSSPTTPDKKEIVEDKTILTVSSYKDENQRLIDLFINTKDMEGLSNQTLTFYNHSIKSFHDYNQKHLKEVQTEDIREFFVYYQKLNNCSNTTLDNVRRNISSFFNWLHLEEHIPKNPMNRIKKIKSSKRVRHPLKKEEVEIIREELMSNTYSLRDRCIFELLLSSGIRNSELCQLNRSDLDFENKTFRVIGKGDKERICYFNDSTKSLLLEYLSTRTDDDSALFMGKRGRLVPNGVGRVLRETAKRRDIELFPHKCRHTFATNMLNNGMPLEQVQQLLGHESMDTTLIYAEVAQENIKKSYNEYME